MGNNKQINKEKSMDWTSRSFTDYSIDKENRITGVPVVFNQKTDIGGWFSEEIKSGAISYDALKDAAFFFNHKIDKLPIARVRTKKLSFEITDHDVKMIADPNRERSDVNDLYIAIQDGDVDGMSFMFRVDAQKWENLDSDYPHRIIEKISYVREVSAVTYPAYAGTSINARSDAAVDIAKETLESARAEALESADDGNGSSSETRTKIDIAKARAKAKY